MSRTTLPTYDQLLHLVRRAENKGGLTPAEGDRLRIGLGRIATNPAEPPELIDLRRRNMNLSKSVSYWKRKAETAEAAAATPAPEPAPAPAPAPAPTPPVTPVPDHELTQAERDARDALRRVAALAQRWQYIPAKRQAAHAVLAAITNKDDDD